MAGTRQVEPKATFVGRAGTSAKGTIQFVARDGNNHLAPNFVENLGKRERFSHQLTRAGIWQIQVEA